MPNALIWGASGGIGIALVERLADAGWEVYGAGRRSDAISEKARGVYAFEADDENSIESVVRMVAMETDTIDLMAYVAGGLAYEKLDDMTGEDWLATLHANVTGAFYSARHTTPLLAKDGHFVFIGAYLDHIELPKMGAYVAGKAALAEFAVVLAKEQRRRRVTVVRPGAVATPFWEQVSFKMPADAKAPEVVADAILAHHLNGGSGYLDL